MALCHVALRLRDMRVDFCITHARGRVRNCSKSITSRSPPAVASCCCLLIGIHSKPNSSQHSCQSAVSDMMTTSWLIIERKHAGGVAGGAGGRHDGCVCANRTVGPLQAAIGTGQLRRLWCWWRCHLAPSAPSAGAKFTMTGRTQKQLFDLAPSLPDLLPTMGCSSRLAHGAVTSL